MNKMLIPILFAVGTALFWGCYGPTIGNAQTPRVDGKPLMPPDGWTPLQAVCVHRNRLPGHRDHRRTGNDEGQGDSFSYSAAVPGAEGMTHFLPAKWGFLAGALGAFGALCLTTAMMTSRGNALLVMPIVFGGGRLRDRDRVHHQITWSWTDRNQPAALGRHAANRRRCGPGCDEHATRARPQETRGRGDRTGCRYWRRHRRVPGVQPRSVLR